ncbi:protein-glutamate methylesterase/protein-glutamine glutaminase [Neomoorella mulderi]|uniref:Protein-glutamate methylesterase/protein-glutamine glutaminase n=1 Tax=Moorella mulderi DSM 14980 TaxID=1122241 RepID=A0A151AYQ9_9FIRM|nr:chemotaxis response regulator protein-glutamate methylesterase [Moorella mulderi]KYH32700.1 chemotaxis response regulator protein-glutamate methylesterase [Moorella mulderi DSM 14980]
MNWPVKVLVVDDSAFSRRLLIDILKADPGIQVVGYARNGEEALEKVASLQPQVVTLDLEMPVMDGLATLKNLMASSPVAVIMLSAHTAAGAEVTIKALELGAVDFVLKPAKSGDIKELARILPEKIKAAARVPVGRLCRGKPCREIIPAPFISPRQGQIEVVAIGTSTGGPAALQQVLTALPGDLPAGIVIVQHMPPGFTGPLARRLNELAALEIREAVAGDVVRPGLALIAPAGKQMLLERHAGSVQVQLAAEAEVPTLFKPSVDVLMLSVARVYGPRSLGVILTGMGNDGVRGLKAIKERGGQVLAQDEGTCIVYGMPRAAVEAGLADQVLPLPAIAGAIVSLVAPRT